MRKRMRKYLTLVLMLTDMEVFLTIELPTLNKMPSEITKQYPGYEKIFHFDNKTLKEVDVFLGHNYKSYTVTLINYDDYGEFERPVGYKFVHIVYLNDPFKFETFSNGKFNLEFNDVVIFVTRKFVEHIEINPNIEVFYIWQLKGLDRSGCVIIYDILSDDFYYVHFYAGNMTGILNKVRVKSAVPRLLDYVNEFKNFNGHTFNIAYYPYAPFIMCKNDNRKYECPVEGIDGMILMILSRYLNFKFQMKKANLRSGGEWKAMIEDVHFGRMDWAVGGISTTLERMALADFTTMLHMESFIGLYSETEEALNKWDNILLPFQILSWIFLCLSMISIIFILQIAAVLLIRQKSQRIEYFWIPLRGVVEQTMPKLHLHTSTIKIILSTWVMSAIIITTAYKSKLASSMIKPQRNEPGSILDLYDQGYTFQVNTEDWTVLKESLSQAYDKRYRSVVEKCKDDLQFCPAAANTLGLKVALIDEETPTQYIVSEQCESFTTHDLSRFRLVKRKLFPSIHAWPLQLSAPYRFRFSKTIQRLIAGGIIEYWYKSVVSRPILSYQQNPSKARSLTISTFMGPAFVFACGIGLSIVVFISEIIYFNYIR